MKYVFYYISLVLIFLGVMSCTDSKFPFKEDKKQLDHNNKAWLIRNPIIYKGTAVYEAAKAIADKDHNALRAWAVKASDESLNFQDVQFNIPLNLFAYQKSKIEALKILTEAGADPNLQSDYNESVFLSVCSELSIKDYSLMAYLLANGGNSNAESSHPIHHTPLIAISKTNLENVKKLVNAGANINYIMRYPDGKVKSPLKVALDYKRIHIGKIIIFSKKDWTLELLTDLL